MIRLPERPLQASLLADLTPLLDVLFIVLVFFLLTANAPLISLPMQLPQSGDQAPTGGGDDQRKQLLLMQSGEWQLDGAAYLDLAQLRSSSGLTAEDRLDIAVDRDARADALVRLLAWLATAGITDTRLLMEPEHD